ncbi:50S ribosomal protein L22 [Candidatus Micrarchaeota archaeon]|nr:50S ribosomal protein L22 [Candidatus Micrarchaeota archaeon]
MPKRYMIKNDASKKRAYARIEDIDVSFKKLAAVCDNVRGMQIDNALSFLEEAVNMKRPIRFRKWNKKMGHRRQLGGKKGRYPINAIKIIINLLKNARANADAKGILNPFIVHIAANKQHSYPRLSPKGRPMLTNYETAFAEVVLEDRV